MRWNDRVCVRFVCKNMVIFSETLQIKINFRNILNMVNQTGFKDPKARKTMVNRM